MTSASVATATNQEVLSEVLANLFQAIVDEMAWIVVRSAHTTFIKETQDFGAALVTPEGEMFAYPFTSCATSLIGVPMAKVLNETRWQPGDILAANDPYSTSGMVMHLNDFYLIRPIFVEGELLCFAWGFLHLTDIGGYAPGSIDMQNNEVFQEGLRVSPIKLFEDDRLRSDIWQIVADNSRIPGPNYGDVMALVSALRRAEDRMTSLVARHGTANVKNGMKGVLDATEKEARRVLASVPPGEYRFVDYFEDDYVSEVPIRLAVSMTPSPEGTITLDYRGSDPQVQAALNLPTSGQLHHPFLSLAITNFVVTQSSSIHINAGIQRCIDLVLPEASVVNCTFPAAVGMRWSTAMRLHDLVLGALNSAKPGSVPAAGAGQVVVTYVSTVAPGRAGRVVVANPVVGGTGGGPDRDGESGIDFPSAFLRNVPVEVLEAEVPVIVERFGVVPDSEGPGRYRGGLGVQYDLRMNDQLATVVMRGKDRHRFTPWGIAGGGTGSAGACWVTDAETAEDRELGKRTLYRAGMGEVVHIRGSGGGGFGNPLERDIDAVATDVNDGLVSPERAAEVYGVVMQGEAADFERSDEIRRLRSPHDEIDAEVAVDLGLARSLWEAEYGELSSGLSHWLTTLPPSLRHQAKLLAYKMATGNLANGQSPDIEEIFKEVERIVLWRAEPAPSDDGEPGDGPH